MVIQGNGFKLDGLGLRRVVYVNGTGLASIELSDITLTGGFVAASSFE